jgi:hypothetical protein
VVADEADIVVSGFAVVMGSSLNRPPSYTSREGHKTKGWRICHAVPDAMRMSHDAPKAQGGRPKRDNQTFRAYAEEMGGQWIVRD